MNNLRKLNKTSLRTEENGGKSDKTLGGPERVLGGSEKS